MEVAGQWRRQWAGTAEYGKVTEGGVTRRVARAMEVLHASAPGARVRVMRAAYHSTSGPGIPASSYMLHSSRRVISSGFNILESPTFPSKPLEISSTPLESSPESNLETENYKVTEPDDMDISEPSKWRGTTSGSSIRMPSEESSSTDNASIVDLDSRLHKGLNRKYSYDSENSDIHSFKRSSARTSPLLDAPVTLSTLKYKSLLNNSNDWNNRRKSYSFEDTSPLNEVMVQSNDTLAMESSTDSGICKSSEIVNDYTEDTNNINDFVGRDKIYNIHRENPIDNWQFNNKPSNFYKGSKMKSFREHDTVVDDSLENNIALQSTGKVTITVPITIEGADDDKLEDRRVKKVGFCKTELHFAAESGRVNIIATDEKPPPSNDFRKRRSAFVPINDRFEKPITLFGEKSDLTERNNIDECRIRNFSETVELDENTAATKSILKNKIPKPKPYLLGENMVFGESQNVNRAHDGPVPLGVSLINKELETQRIRHSKDSTYTYGNVTEKTFIDSLRTFNKSPSKNFSGIDKYKTDDGSDSPRAESKTNNDSIRHKLSALQMSPVPKPKTRQLRESDLTFFGINSNYQNSHDDKKKNHINHKIEFRRDSLDDSFESVRLIKQVSSSAQNSEAESDDYPEYQNIPIKTNFAPIPVPRSRVKYKKFDDEVLVLKPIIEQAYESAKVTPEPRRSRSRKQDEFITLTSRSRSEPAKHYQRDGTVSKNKKQGNTLERGKVTPNDEPKGKTRDSKTINHIADNEVPLYANYEVKDPQPDLNSDLKTRIRGLTEHSEHNTSGRGTKKKGYKSPDRTEKRQNSLKKNGRITENISHSEHSSSKQKIKDHLDSQKNTTSLNGSINKSYRNKDNRKTSTQQSNKEHELKDKTQSSDRNYSKDLKRTKDRIKENTPSSIDRTAKNIDHTRSSKSIDQNSSDYRVHSRELQPAKRDNGEKANGTRRPSRRSEYVIKYDDKNGTVSSISKVRAAHSTSRNKHTSKDRNKEHSKDTKAKSKNLEKSALRK